MHGTGRELILNAAEGALQIILTEDGRPLAAQEWHRPERATELLTPALREMLQRLGLTAGDLRHYFDKFGGNLGQVGCVGFLFSTKGVIAISALDEWGDRVVDGDKLMEEALEAGASDFVEEDNIYEIYCEPDDLSAVADDLAAKGYTFLSSEIEKVPSTYVTLTNEDDIKHMNLLLENLEENEDIVNVWHNWDEA